MPDADPRPPGGDDGLSEAYLSELREEAARLDHLEESRGFAVRIWPNRGERALQAFLDGLQEADREAGLPVYGLWISATCAGDPGAIAVAWRARDRALLGAGTLSEIVPVVIQDAAIRPNGEEA